MERFIMWFLALVSVAGACLSVSSCINRHGTWYDAGKRAGDTGYYSSPHVTRPANIGGYTECPLVFKKKDGTYYAKVTVCHRA